MKVYIYSILYIFGYLLQLKIEFGDFFLIFWFFFPKIWWLKHYILQFDKKIAIWWNFTSKKPCPCLYGLTMCVYFCQGFDFIHSLCHKRVYSRWVPQIDALGGVIKLEVNYAIWACFWTFWAAFYFNLGIAVCL
jgi:hypothetical protein